MLFCVAILVSFERSVSLFSKRSAFVASNFMLLVLFVIVYVILLDELVMSSAQRRFGPFNIGVFGLLASIINGVNLLFVQSFFIMSSYSLVMFSGPLVFLLVLLLLFSLIMPLYLLDVYFSFFVFVLASSVLVFVYFLLSYSSFSKYSIIGSFRIVVQFLAFGLVFDILLAIFAFLYNHATFSVSSLYSLSLYSSFFSFLTTTTRLATLFFLPAPFSTILPFCLFYGFASFLSSFPLVSASLHSLRSIYAFWLPSLSLSLNSTCTTYSLRSFRSLLRSFRSSSFATLFVFFSCYFAHFSYFFVPFFYSA